MKGLFIITIYLCIHLVVTVDYDPIEETLQHIGDELVHEDEDIYEKENILPRSSNIECIQSAVSALKDTAQKLQEQINELEQYINSEPAPVETPSPGPENCESETENQQNSTLKEVPMPMEAYGYSNENQTTTNTKEDPCNENDKLKTWDKQITVCKEILQNNNRNLMDMISDFYPQGHKRTLKINTKHRKSKSNYGKRSGTAWSEWTNWSPCSVSCGAGKQIRFRKCTGAGCNADVELDERQCFQPICSSNFHKTFNNFQSMFDMP